MYFPYRTLIELDTPNRFLHADPADIQPHLQNIANATLRETIMCGIAFYHEGMTDIERSIVDKLYKAGVCIKQHQSTICVCIVL
jgi:replicative superfamily II helicase